MTEIYHVVFVSHRRAALQLNALMSPREFLLEMHWEWPCILNDIFILFSPDVLENTLISFPVVGVFLSKSLHLQQFAGKD